MMKGAEVFNGVEPSPHIYPVSYTHLGFCKHTISRIPRQPLGCFPLFVDGGKNVLAEAQKDYPATTRADADRQHGPADRD